MACCGGGGGGGGDGVGARVVQVLYGVGDECGGGGCGGVVVPLWWC